MNDFMIRFLFCNLFLCPIIGILSIAKRVFQNSLSARMQYHLWFLLLGLFFIPFFPFPVTGLWAVFSWFPSLESVPIAEPFRNLGQPTGTTPINPGNWMNDFTLSIYQEASLTPGYLLLGAWILGIFVMMIWFLKTWLRMNDLKKSALPLQNAKALELYNGCLTELNITRKIPVCTTAYLKSPVLAGWIRPCIYLPIHLISDFSKRDLRYMLLHELQHYKHKDAFAGFLMNLAGIVYWFHPLVWYALKEMRNDRELACDASVLGILSEKDYGMYGHTLLNFAEKISLFSFPFAPGLGGSGKQMQRRIRNIASYQKPTLRRTIKSTAAFLITALLLWGLAPLLSTYAAKEERFHWNSSTEKISYMNASSYFDGYKGCFVLYDLDQDVWRLYNKEYATLRTAPNSTYKIYDALFGLEEHIITPEDSLLTWNKTPYPIKAWNQNQTLASALQLSVNWYFQEIDRQLGEDTLSRYLREIGYGNENIQGGLSSYWMESSLSISPVEQVELLSKLYQNKLGFAPEHTKAVKDALRLSSSDTGTLYGKTGTGRMNGQNVNGWFVGFVESGSSVFFFATNIQGDTDASGSNAAEITMSLLSHMGVWTP